jgi:hypothetical protein
MQLNLSLHWVLGEKDVSNCLRATWYGATDLNVFGAPVAGNCLSFLTLSLDFRI